jgi:hypothetical protein
MKTSNLVVSDAAKIVLEKLFSPVTEDLIALMVRDAMGNEQTAIFTGHRYEQEGNDVVVVVGPPEVPVALMTGDEYAVLESVINQLPA